jgi:hypothetical protein
MFLNQSLALPRFAAANHIPSPCKRGTAAKSSRIHRVQLWNASACVAGTKDGKQRSTRCGCSTSLRLCFRRGVRARTTCCSSLHQGERAFFSTIRCSPICLGLALAVQQGVTDDANTLQICYARYDWAKPLKWQLRPAPKSESESGISPMCDTLHVILPFLAGWARQMAVRHR